MCTSKTRLLRPARRCLNHTGSSGHLSRTVQTILEERARERVGRGKQGGVQSGRRERDGQRCALAIGMVLALLAMRVRRSSSTSTRLRQGTRHMLWEGRWRCCRQGRSVQVVQACGCSGKRGCDV